MAGNLAANDLAEDGIRHVCISLSKSVRSAPIVSHCRRVLARLWNGSIGGKLPSNLA
jgi:hypothetical protein